ncbi:MAG: Holliday junction branch migration protein RuvA [Bryobacteraceae bacterium]
MIGQLRGTLLEKHPNEAIIDVHGVGYQVTIPVSTFSALPDTGTEVKLQIHTHVREDAIALFGFLTKNEKALFEKLISVSGIGPKLGVTVLSGLPASDLVAAIRAGNLPQLTRVPGIGKKTAERLVVELRDKLDQLGPAGPAPTATPAGPAFTPVDEDVLSALVNLGCPKPAAEAAIRKARAAGIGDSFEPLFRKALELVR